MARECGETTGQPRGKERGNDEKDGRIKTIPAAVRRSTCTVLAYARLLLLRRTTYVVASYTSQYFLLSLSLNN